MIACSGEAQTWRETSKNRVHQDGQPKLPIGQRPSFRCFQVQALLGQTGPDRDRRTLFLSAHLSTQMPRENLDFRLIPVILGTGGGISWLRETAPPATVSVRG